MCQTALYKDVKCKHHWMRITRPCALGAGFSTCPSFSYNSHTYAHTHSNYYNGQQLPADGLCHQPLCPYQGHPHPKHTPPLSPVLAPSTQIQAQGQLYQIQGIQGHNTCHINYPSHQVQVQVQHNCPYHQNLVTKPAPPSYIARSEPCPECDLKGVYDRNQIRMVTKIKKGVKLGGGPSGGDPGVEVRCCVM